MPYKRVILYPWKMSSSGAKMVAAHLTTMGVDCLRVHSDRDYKPKDGDLIMGWGAGYRPEWMDHVSNIDYHYINTWKGICNSVSKVTSFGLFKKHSVPTVPWTQSHDSAVKWSADGHWVCCRTNTEGMDGAGLVLAKKPSEMEWAGLYTKYIKNNREYRIYTFAGRVVDVLTKVPDDDVKDKYIRTESNNYIYARGADCSPEAKAAAIAATDALDLTFAGVDLIIDEEGEPYVLETNTAPGIGQITAQRIAQAIKEYGGL